MGILIWDTSCRATSAILLPVIVKRSSGLDGAAVASGATIVIDVFRAYSAAAYALVAGAEAIVLAAEVDEARELAATMPGSVLMGEVGGVRPDDFDLGNSPGEIMANPGLVSGRTLVHRSSAGTRCARAALANGAEPVFVASLVVASATAAAVAGKAEVTIVASGVSGVEVAAEDEICADLLEALLVNGDADPAAAAAAVANHERAQYLKSASFAHPDDVPLCTAVDRFGFAMEARTMSGHVIISPTKDPRG
jgi:2-phosphosulfolactate phosphatase